MKYALIVNTLSPEDVVDAIRRGLDMPLPERQRRWESLMHDVTNGNVTAWRDAFVSSLSGDSREGNAPLPEG